MAEDYYKTRVDSFLTKTDIKPRDHQPFGHTDKAREEGRQKLLEAARKREKFLI